MGDFGVKKIPHSTRCAQWGSIYVQSGMITTQKRSNSPCRWVQTLG
jgi:hypothetical protein